MTFFSFILSPVKRDNHAGDIASQQVSPGGRDLAAAGSIRQHASRVRPYHLLCYHLLCYHLRIQILTRLTFIETVKLYRYFLSFCLSTRFSKHYRLPKNWCLFAIHRRHRSVAAPLTHIILSKCIWTMTTLFFIFMFMMSGMRRLVFSRSAVGSVDLVGSTHHRHCECRFTTLGVEGGRKEWVWWTWSLWFVRWSDW